MSIEYVKKLLRTYLELTVHHICNGIISDAKEVLKSEWKKIKEGEPAYQQSKQFAIKGGVIVVSATILLLGAYSIFRNPDEDQPRACNCIVAAEPSTKLGGTPSKSSNVSNTNPASNIANNVNSSAANKRPSSAP